VGNDGGVGAAASASRQQNRLESPWVRSPDTALLEGVGRERGGSGERGGGPISQRVFSGSLPGASGRWTPSSGSARLDPCALRCFLEGFQVEVLDNLLDLFVLHCDHQGDRIAGSGIINVAGPGRDFTGGAGPGPRTPSSGRWRGPSRTPSGPSPRQGSRLPSPAGRALQPHSRAPTGRGSPCPRV